MKLYAVFQKEGAPKKGVPRQLPHSPHPISTAAYFAKAQFTLVVF